MYIQFDILNPAFDYFFSVGASIGLIIAGFAAVLAVLKLA